MKQGWEYGFLEDAVNKASSNISLNKIKGDDGYYPVFGAKGFVKNVSFYQQESEYLGIIKDGAGIGRVSRHPEKSSILATMQYILPKKGFDIQFINYFLNYIDFEKYRTGSTIPHIYYKDYKSEPFPLVNIEEQKRIVAKLDECFEAIDKARANVEKNLNNAKELFQSQLNQIFSQKGDGWVEKELMDILELQPRNGWSPPSKYHANTGTPVLTLSSVTGFNFNLSKIKFTSAPIDQSAHYWVNNDDLLITRSNTLELVGHVAICKGIINPVIYSDLIMKMKINPSMANTRFIYYQLRTTRLRRLIKYRAKGASSTMQKINKLTVQSLPIVLPTIKIQKHLVNEFEIFKNKMESLESNYQQELDALDELRKSILQKAFNGEL
tara:strand:+ start:984 stop:2129 length:1146 start_codon:yes stop_codon:yes gene_type:complete